MALSYSNSCWRQFEFLQVWGGGALFSSAGLYEERNGKDASHDGKNGGNVADFGEISGDGSKSSIHLG